MSKKGLLKIYVEEKKGHLELSNNESTATACPQTFVRIYRYLIVFCLQQGQFRMRRKSHLKLSRRRIKVPLRHTNR